MQGQRSTRLFTLQMLKLLFFVLPIVAQSLKIQLRQRRHLSPRPFPLPLARVSRPFNGAQDESFFPTFDLQTLNHPASHSQQFHQLPPPLNFSISHPQICSDDGHLISFSCSFFFWRSLFRLLSHQIFAQIVQL